jgi:hypothetical protein
MARFLQKTMGSKSDLIDNHFFQYMLCVFSEHFKVTNIQCMYCLRDEVSCVSLFLNKQRVESRHRE